MRLKMLILCLKDFFVSLFLISVSFFFFLFFYRKISYKLFFLLSFFLLVACARLCFLSLLTYNRLLCGSQLSFESYSTTTTAAEVKTPSIFLLWWWREFSHFSNFITVLMLRWEAAVSREKIHIDSKKNHSILFF